MIKRVFLAVFWAVLLLSSSTVQASESADSVHLFVERIAPEHGKDFVVETIAAPAGEIVRFPRL